jgi:hypothetical protein
VAVLGERAQVVFDARRECVRRVAIVVEVELDLAEALSRESRELIEEVRPVLFARKEEAVTRGPIVAIAELTERRVAVRPCVDAGIAHIVGSAAPQGLVVVAQGEQHVA